MSRAVLSGLSLSYCLSEVTCGNCNVVLIRVYVHRSRSSICGKCRGSVSSPRLPGLHSLGRWWPRRDRAPDRRAGRAWPGMRGTRAVLSLSPQEAGEQHTRYKQMPYFAAKRSPELE